MQIFLLDFALLPWLERRSMNNNSTISRFTSIAVQRLKSNGITSKILRKGAVALLFLQLLTLTFGIAAPLVAVMDILGCLSQWVRTFRLLDEGEENQLGTLLIQDVREQPWTMGERPDKFPRSSAVLVLLQSIIFWALLVGPPSANYLRTDYFVIGVCVSAVLTGGFGLLAKVVFQDRESRKAGRNDSFDERPSLAIPVLHNGRTDDEVPHQYTRLGNDHETEPPDGFVPPVEPAGPLAGGLDQEAF